jgi:hypothetical protein
MLWMRPHPGAVYRHPTMEAAVAAITVRLSGLAYRLIPYAW